jgi:hypothetical protein
MLNNSEAIEWVLNAHLDVAREYRLNIEKEIWHVRRIYGGQLREDVIRALKQSIKEIEIPAYPTPTDRETVASVWNKCPKPNFMKIRAEYLEMIDSL